MLDRGKTNDGTALTEADKSELKNILARRLQVQEELKKIEFQSATLTFDHDFTVDVGNREVERAQQGDSIPPLARGAPWPSSRSIR